MDRKARNSISSKASLEEMDNTFQKNNQPYLRNNKITLSGRLLGALARFLTLVTEGTFLYFGGLGS